MAKKSTNAEVNKRLLEVYTMLIQNYSYMDIVRYCKQNYQLSRSGTDKYIKAATKKITESNEITTEELRSKTTEQIKDLYNKCYKQGDYTECGRLLSRLAKINGLEVQKIEHSGKIDIPDIKEIFQDFAKQLKGE